MAQVVQKRCRKRLRPRLLVELLRLGELVTACVDSVEKRLHDVGCADGVGEARVLGARKHERGEAELPHTTESLHFSGVEQRSNDPLRHAFKGDQTVDRVPEDHPSRYHCAFRTPASRSGRLSELRN